MAEVLVTGGAGFIGSHVAEYYAKQGHNVTVYDNLSRVKTLKTADKSETAVMYNWNYLKQFKNVTLLRKDVRDQKDIEEAAKDADIIVHAAAQVAVTTSVDDPRQDFETNAMGTLNVLEAARKSIKSPAIVYCSTNKVYGENVNDLPLIEDESRYRFKDIQGVSEDLSIDLCEHTPYGCSKLTGDLYMQDYSRLYDLNAGIFRMSCIYGTRQFGNEDQGWIAHFVISTINGKPLTIYGDGKQVRDVLYITDLIQAYDNFIQNSKKLSGQVFNMGGGPENTISLTELLNILQQETGKKSELNYSDWRPSDQKVYISDTSKAKEKLDWKPKVTPTKGIRTLIEWYKTVER